MTFVRYLREQVDRNDAIGDFARDMLTAARRPRGKAGYMAWYDFLSERIHSSLAKRVFRQAWDEYKVEHKDNMTK